MQAVNILQPSSQGASSREIGDRMLRSVHVLPDARSRQADAHQFSSLSCTIFRALAYHFQLGPEVQLRRSQTRASLGEADF